MSKPPVRDSRIPCQNCNQGTLFWNPEESVYVCMKCGIQEEALKTWIGAAQSRQKKKKKKQEKERQWALEILGIKDRLKSPRKSKLEEEWADIIKTIKNRESKS
ncbi:MAG: hypothetical protein ACFFDT_39965 [Candidatus Hodarchaeota archaeon]